jgi:hypothetical protein
MELGPAVALVSDRPENGGLGTADRMFRVEEVITDFSRVHECLDGIREEHRTMEAGDGGDRVEPRRYLAGEFAGLVLPTEVYEPLCR